MEADTAVFFSPRLKNLMRLVILGTEPLVPKTLPRVYRALTPCTLPRPACQAGQEVAFLHQVLLHRELGHLSYSLSLSPHASINGREQEVNKTKPFLLKATRWCRPHVEESAGSQTLLVLFDGT